jgi:ATP-dependent Clp protease, protease subunit
MSTTNAHRTAPANAGPLDGWPGLPGTPRPPEIHPPGVPWPTPAPPTPVVAPSWFHEGAVGAEVRDRLLERRCVLVTGFLDDHTATRAAAEIMLLDGTGDDPIDVHLSCPDGDLAAASALADTIDLAGVEVRALARGTVGGPAIGPFTAADRRLASGLSLFQLRDPRAEGHGSADELVALAERHRHEVDSMHRRIARATGQDLEVVASRFAAGDVLDADEARRFGLVHEVRRVTPAPVTPLRDDR